MNKKTHSFWSNHLKFYTNLKSTEDLKKEFKRDSITIKKIESYLLIAWVQIILDNSLAFTIKVYEWLLPKFHET